VEVPGYGRVTGDIAWGGNWFFLVSDHGQQLSMKNLETLTNLSWRIRQALIRNNVTGRDGAEIDHIELFGPSKTADSQNFVLCPGKAYDRSPCGTGTSAKLACLFADGKLREGQVWKQESIIGSVFEGTIHRAGDDLIPTIKGSAHITAESTLILDPRDPLRTGIRT
jgi:4-hydroxyproline epimerase